MQKEQIRIGTEELKWVLMNACHAAVCHYDKVIDEDLREGWTADAENMRLKKAQIKTVLDAVLDADEDMLHKIIFGKREDYEKWASIKFGEDPYFPALPNETSSRAAEEALSVLASEGIDINGELLFVD